MNLKHAESYFAALAKEVETPLVLALTGGIASNILADERTTDDIDFAILRYVKKDWPATETLLRRLAKKHGIAIQYHEDIGRWSMVSFLDWRKHSLPYKKAGMLEVRVLDPYYWSIGKITRGTERDLKDLRAVIRKRGLDWKKLARLWARALRESPISIRLSNVLRQMELFLRESKKNVFEKGYNPEKAVGYFKKLAVRGGRVKAKNRVKL
jgi:hypothetical protein